MITAWQVLGAAIVDIRHIGVILVAYNLLWFVCCLPLITAPPATAALYVIVREIGSRRNVAWRDFFQAMRQYFVVGWRWGALNLVMVFMTLLNIAFYGSMTFSIAPVLRAVWIVFGVLWVVIQQYSFPLLLEQVEPRVWLATRNAFVLFLRHPLFTLIYALVAGTFVLMTIAVPYFWMLFTVALIFYFYTQGVRYLARLEKGEEPEI